MYRHIVIIAGVPVSGGLSVPDATMMMLAHKLPPVTFYHGHCTAPTWYTTTTTTTLSILNLVSYLAKLHFEVTSRHRTDKSRQTFRRKGRAPAQLVNTLSRLISIKAEPVAERKSLSLALTTKRIQIVHLDGIRFGPKPLYQTYKEHQQQLAVQKVCRGYARKHSF